MKKYEPDAAGIFVSNAKNPDVMRTLTRKLKFFDPGKKRALIGLDGFVDEVLHVVRKRYDASSYDRMDSLTEYGTRIAQSAGLSLNVEMLPIRTKLGGNGVIFANSLSVHGVDVAYIGALGEDAIHPVFREMEQRMQLFSLCEPAHTDAIEFKDGKIISSRLESFRQITPQRLADCVGQDALIRLLAQADMAGFENWTMIMSMSDIWEYLLTDILPYVRFPKKAKLFIDLADPSKRTPDDIRRALRLLEQFTEYYEVILGLNKKEANLLVSILTGEETHAEISEAAVLLKQHLRVDKIIIHTARAACAISAKNAAAADSPYCENPKATTGAGDHFNAGYMLGELGGFSLEECLLLGVHNAGFYVRNARSASYAQLQEYLDLQIACADAETAQNE